jgi:hypothetical protein
MKETLREQAARTNSPATQILSDGSMVRFGKIEQMDREFDLEFWQAQSSTARLDAAWNMVIWYLKVMPQW